MKKLFFAIILLCGLNGWAETKQMSCSRSEGGEWICVDTQKNSVKSESSSNSKDNPLVFVFFGAGLFVLYTVMKNDREKDDSYLRC